MPRSPAICLLVVLSMLAACASGPGGTASQRKAHRSLERGDCPDVIVYPGERGDAGRERYGHAAAGAHLAQYHDRELANCRAALARGDARAMRVLVDYGYQKKNPGQVVEAYKSYLEHGSDEAVLAEASATLYKLYSGGEPGLPADPDAAFYYLGLAVEYDLEQFELSYADALYARGLYADAYAYYEKLLAGNASGGVAPTDEQVCEIYFRKADMHFRGRGVRENWYTGYYYWLKASDLAGDPRYGACRRDSFVYRDSYALESERKKAVDRRLARLGPSEKARVEAAWRSGADGLEQVQAMKFRRPPGVINDDVAPPQVASSPALAAGSGSGNSAGWRDWEPLSAGICRLQSGTAALSWAQVFQLRSGAVWTVQSTGGETTTAGSAVAVSPNRLVTNCHLVQDPASVTLLKDGQSRRAQVAAADREGDRCILRTFDAMADYVVAARPGDELLVGEDVAAIGNPRGLATSLSRGIVAQKRNRNGHAYIQTDAAISTGSSGGGLFDGAGNLVGITTFKVASGENLNFAIAVDEFCRL